MARALGISGLGMLLRKVNAWQGVINLAYHRIGETLRRPFDRALWSATARNFDEQMRFLKKHFDVIGINDLGRVLSRGRGRYVLVTFDDGYRDNYEVAYPLLKAHGVPALFFIATGFLDRPKAPWWDEIAWMIRLSTAEYLPSSPWLSEPVQFDEPWRENAIRTVAAAHKALLPGKNAEDFLEFLALALGTGRYNDPNIAESWMTWDMVRELKAGGMAIGGHTVNHPILRRLPAEQQMEEIGECGKRLAAELGQPMRWFSYPFGGHDAFDEQTRACLRKQGVQFAFSYKSGFQRFGDWDQFNIRRVPIEWEINHEWFHALATLPQLFC
jgi:peptidoglycan/xylan/chitin deacetylase (PgdA/CDA1 family)